MARGLFLICGLLALAVPIAAPAPPEAAARNNWLQHETEHFQIIYTERDRQTAAEVASLAPGVFERVSRFLDYAPRERIPVVIHGNTAIANGFYSPYPPRINLFVSSPSGPWLGASTPDWIETLFVHELIHYVHLARPVGFFGSLSRVFGPLATAASVPFMPGWFVEGIATYGESALAPGGRGENPFFEMLHVAPVLEDRMYGYDQAGYSSDSAPAGRIYAAGYLIVDYLLEEHGEEAFVELNRAFQRAPFFGMRRAIRRTTGTRAEDLYAEMVASLEKRYAERTESADAGSGHAPTIVLSPAGPGSWTLPTATERGLVFWGRGLDAVPGLYLWSWDDVWDAERTASVVAARDSVPAAPRLLSAAVPLDQWSWTVDRAGRRAVVAVLEPQLSGKFGDESSSDLYLLDLEAQRTGGKATRLTRGARLFHPALSPDGSDLVAVQRAGSFARLVRIDTTTGLLQPLYHPGPATLFTPTFSPDGEMIAVAENRSGRQHIILLDARDGSLLARSSAVGLHFPRFVDTGEELELWYGGEVEQRLTLLRSRVVRRAERQALQLSPPELVLRDPVAAFAGFPVPSLRSANQPGGGGNGGGGAGSSAEAIIYASYTADGYAVKLAAGGGNSGSSADALHPGNDSPGGARAAKGPQRDLASDREPAPASGGLSGERRYRDLPRPILWLPQFMLRAGTDDDAELDIGAVLVAASNLERHDVLLSLTCNPWAEQPTALLNWGYTPRHTRFQLRVQQDYSRLDSSEQYQRTTLTAGVERPLLQQTYPGFTRRLDASFDTEYRNTMAAPDERSFLGTLRSPDRVSLDELSLALALRVASSGRGAIRDFYGPAGRSLAATIEYRPALLDAPDHRIETTTVAAVALNAPAPLRRLQFVPAAAVTSSSAGDALDRLPYRGGGFADRRTVGSAAETLVADWGWLGRLELRLPLGVYDAAWRGLASTGAGISIYAEQGGMFGNNGPSATASTVLGTELTSSLFFNMIGFRLTGGAAVRVPHPGSVTDPGWMLYARASM